MAAWCVATLGAQSRSSAPPQPAETFVAMLGSNGVVVPFAKFANDRWSNDGAGAFDGEAAQWPKPWFFPTFEPGRTRRLSEWSALLVPSDVIPRSEWQQRKRTVHTVNAIAVRAGCELQWGLTGDAPAFTRDADGGASTVGVAVTGVHAMQGFVDIEQSAPIVSKLETFVEPLFNQSEDAAIARPKFPRSRPFPATATRRAAPLALDVTRTDERIGGRYLYLVRAERTYRGPSSPQRCDDQFGIMNIWIGEDATGRLESLGSEMVLTECGEKNSAARSPLATFELGGRTFVTQIESGYEAGEFVILEIAEHEVRRQLATSAGGC
jgi:hypothetical protein